ncbi:MAG: adenylosuccinate lyase [Elusimicrobia bacterium]|nr:adenylosuccinate lyase [Elusimicrobiota bacterium]
MRNDLNAITPVDGRYRELTAGLSGYFTEARLIYHRIIAEAEYFLALAATPGAGIRRLTKREKEFIKNLPCKIMPEQVKRIETRGGKNIPPTNHDVKAVEYCIKEEFSKTGLRDLKEFIHIAATSEDINSLAYGMILSKTLSETIIPMLKEILIELEALAEKHSNLPLLARTHGQPAVGTTFGKEFKVFSARLSRHLRFLENFKITAKFSGAAGNYNAHTAAFPRIKWIDFSENLIRKLNNTLKIKLSLNKLTTQIEPHDNYAELFDAMRRTNTILIDFCQDVWRYISDGLLVQKPVKGEIGSSTMPHKINPINFENAEGNLGIANALFEFFSRKLPVSRLQRDLSDSTVKRNFGTAFAHSLIAYKFILKGLKKIQVNAWKAEEELKNHPEIYAEAIQTILRREGFENPYELLKDFTRGSEINFEKLESFIEQLETGKNTKKELKNLIKKPYIGLAPALAKLKTENRG